MPKLLPQDLPYISKFNKMHDHTMLNPNQTNCIPNVTPKYFSKRNGNGTSEKNDSVRTGSNSKRITPRNEKPSKTNYSTLYLGGMLIMNCMQMSLCFWVPAKLLGLS